MGIDARQAKVVKSPRGRAPKISGARWTARSLAAPAALAALVALCGAIVAQADRTPLKPGVDLFSTRDDIEIGLRNARGAEKELPMLDDSRVNDYLDALGKRLATHAPGYPFPYRFRCVNDESVNAFALPGGFIYVDRGVIEAADDEAQLAGVLAHEIAHVALRHGTHQATKAYLSEMPFSAASSLFGPMSGAVTQLSSGFAVDSILLKYSRASETQADVLGTQIVYDSGYDPRALAQFFEIVEDETKRPHRVTFFENHPNPDHRIDRIMHEVDRLGGPAPNYVSNSDDFQDIRRYLRAMPAPAAPQRKRKTPGAGVTLASFPGSARASSQTSGTK
jgi:predicted Zn-dependent protease